jgi:hypothetical protein
MLSMDQVEQFRREGYLLLRQFLSYNEVWDARNELDRLLKSPDSVPARMELRREYCSIPDSSNPENVWLITNTPIAGNWWLRRTFDRRTLEVVCDCLGPAIDFQMGFARVRPPGHHSFCSWHQDWPYDRHSSPELVTTLFYLDTTTADRGSTWVVPRSHLVGEWTHDGPALIAEQRVGGRGLPVEAAPGDVLLLHVLTVHRAGRNAGGTPIRLLIDQYKSANSHPLNKNSHALSGLPLHRVDQLRSPNLKVASYLQTALTEILAVKGPATASQIAETLLKENKILYLRLGGLEGLCRTLTRGVRSHMMTVSWGEYRALSRA